MSTTPITGCSSGFGPKAARRGADGRDEPTRPGDGTKAIRRALADPAASGRIHAAIGVRPAGLGPLGPTVGSFHDGHAARRRRQS